MKNEKKQDWFFTFGFGQQYAGCYTVLQGTFDSTRKEMFRRFGDQWAFQYNSFENAGVERFQMIFIS